MTTDITEAGLEKLIVRAMAGRTELLSPPHQATEMSVPIAGGTGWLLGDANHYNREYAIDLVQLAGFLEATQPAVAATLDLAHGSPTRRKFLARMQGEIAKRGVIDVLRTGIKHGAASIDLFYGAPSKGNDKAIERFAHNRFSVTRQLRYSLDETQRALDIGAFINGLPIATFELKNSLTKQTVSDAVKQYMTDRDPRELLFQFGRCIVHFAVDDAEVRMCTKLDGEDSWFLPFNLGFNHGAGNPPNPDGLKTNYLWKSVLTPASLTNIIENYAQVVEEKSRKTGKIKRVGIFPRYHQLDVVRRLLADVAVTGAGKRYLIQHSAGSGKSNSIAWLAHQLIGVEKNDSRVFDSIIVVTDRRVLDKQICDTIKQFAQVGATVGHAERSGDLREFIQSGKKIIITTVQKFPHVLDEIGAEHKDKRFAVVIDEAHSSQGSKTAAAMNFALAGNDADGDETTEEHINRIMEGRKMLPNASYFAFTATPKNKTLELFGEPFDEDGKVKHRPFHSYTMKQAIQEGFILDVLRNYTPVESYYKLVKKIEDDPEFDARRAQKKLRKYVESHKHAIREKAEIMVDHFHDQVIALNKIGGKARAMIVTSGIERAIQYFHAFRECLEERKSPYKTIVAFSGEHEYGGAKVTESSLNGFQSNEIVDRIQADPYRFLICADKFQTGYDEPLLHTMYVDKPLSDIKAVQTLSRLNRAHPQKLDVFVLDFMNDAKTILAAFSDYYRTTILSEETDPNKLHDLKSELDATQVYSPEAVDRFVELYLGDADRDQLDPILDVCVAKYLAELDEDGQVQFKGKAKTFTRTYGFLSAVLPFSNPAWEKLSIFLDFLTPKLPAPKEEDLSKGVLESIDMDSYRAEKKATMQIALVDANAEISPVPVSGGGHKREPELERLSSIVKTFNDMFGNIPWADADRILHRITHEIPAAVAKDTAFKNAKKNSDRQNARIEHDKALARVITSMLGDDTELFKQFMDNGSFRDWLAEKIFDLTYTAEDAEAAKLREAGRWMTLAKHLASAGYIHSRLKDRKDAAPWKPASDDPAEVKKLLTLAMELAASTMPAVFEGTKYPPTDLAGLSDHLAQVLDMTERELSNGLNKTERAALAKSAAQLLEPFWARLLAELEPDAFIARMKAFVAEKKGGQIGIAMLHQLLRETKRANLEENSFKLNPETTDGWEKLGTISNAIRDLVAIRLKTSHKSPTFLPEESGQVAWCAIVAILSLVEHNVEALRARGGSEERGMMTVPGLPGVGVTE